MCEMVLYTVWGYMRPELKKSKHGNSKHQSQDIGEFQGVLWRPDVRSD